MPRRTGRWSRLRQERFDVALQVVEILAARLHVGDPEFDALGNLLGRPFAWTSRIMRK
jgi:hypothetical protein